MDGARSAEQENNLGATYTNFGASSASQSAFIRFLTSRRDDEGAPSLRAFRDIRRGSATRAATSMMQSILLGAVSTITGGQRGLHYNETGLARVVEGSGSRPLVL